MKLGHVDIVIYLLESGSLRDARDDDGCTPVFAAADEGNVKLWRKQSPAHHHYHHHHHHHHYHYHHHHSSIFTYLHHLFSTFIV